MNFWQKLIIGINQIVWCFTPFACMIWLQQEQVEIMERMEKLLKKGEK